MGVMPRNSSRSADSVCVGSPPMDAEAAASRRLSVSSRDVRSAAVAVAAASTSALDGAGLADRVA